MPPNFLFVVNTKMFYKNGDFAVIVGLLIIVWSYCFIKMGDFGKQGKGMILCLGQNKDKRRE